MSKVMVFPAPALRIRTKEVSDRERDTASPCFSLKVKGRFHFLVKCSCRAASFSGEGSGGDRNIAEDEGREEQMEEEGKDEDEDAGKDESLGS